MQDQQLEIPPKRDKSFRGKNLQGKSFRGQDLSGADFSGSDIRGANFTNATLRNANFANAKAGLQLHATILFTILLFATAVGLAIITGLLGATIGLQFHASYLAIPAKILAISIHCIFLIVALRKGLTAGFSIFAVAVALAFVAAMIHSVAIPAAGAVAIAIVLDFSVASLTMVGAGVAIVGWIVVNRNVGMIIAAAFATAFLITLGMAPNSVAAVAIVSTVMILSGYVSWRTLRHRDEMHQLSGLLFARWGTSFRGADLTGANFSGTRLKNTDFRRATLTSARWQDQQFDILLN